MPGEDVSFNIVLCKLGDPGVRYQPPEFPKLAKTGPKPSCCQTRSTTKHGPGEQELVALQWMDGAQVTQLGIVNIYGREQNSVKYQPDPKLNALGQRTTSRVT